MPYGNFYYGKDGFFYKKMTAGGARRNFAIGAICNQPQDIFNSYVPGAGVGGTSIATRRAKLIRATKCYGGHKCGRFFTYLGIKPQRSITSLDIISEIEEVQPKPPSIEYRDAAVPTLSNYAPFTLGNWTQETIVSNAGLLSGTYITASSSVWTWTNGDDNNPNATVPEGACAAFGNTPNESGNYWHSFYFNSGNYITIADGSQISGEWLEITLPNSLVLTGYQIGPRGNNANKPVSWYILGLNANSNWEKIDQKSNATINNSPNMTSFTISNVTQNSKLYNTFRIVVTQASGSFVNMVMQLSGYVYVYPSEY
jgi:hypothetical protein